MDKPVFKKADYLLVGLIVVIGLGGFWFNLGGAKASEHKYALVYVKNSMVAELSLVPGENYSYSFSFDEDNRHTAILEIDGGRIRMLPLGESICPQGICSHTGWIAYPYESIVCLPNQIMIVFTAAGEPGSGIVVDGVTY